MENKRRFPRSSSTFQVKYYPESKKVPFGYTLSNDISRGGLCMSASSGTINKGDTVKLEMENKETREYIPATGKVRWLRALGRNAPLDEEVGIEFTEIDPAEIDKLLKNKDNSR